MSVNSKLENISLLNTKEFCALDIETTGINPYSEKIIEIGVTRFSVLHGETDHFCTLINPGKSIPPGVSAIHGITDDMVTSSPFVEKILPELFAFVRSSPLVIHNSRFDLSFIEMECKRAGFEFPKWFSYDTVALSKKYFPEIRNHKLDTVCSFLNVPLNHHRALDDARGCMEVFRACVKKADTNGKWNADQIHNMQEKPIKIGVIKELSEKERKGGSLKIGVPSLITYRDGEGNITERIIVPHGIYKRGKKTLVQAFCRLRGEERFFSVNRIERVKNCDS